MAVTSRKPDLKSSDPFAVLGLDPSVTLDAKEIKRAYKRLALKYHPDVSEEKDKKKASDQFARINWAYETLSGKNRGTTSAGSSTGTTTPGGTGGWQPPHRRQGSYTSSTSTGSSNRASTDWRDYMPGGYYEKDNQDYDAGGDSFEAIFADLFKGAAGAAAGVSSVAGGSGSIFKDFVEFLERNVEGYTPGGSDDDDAQLRILLRTGSIDQVADEMDDTDLVVQQLVNKLKQVDDDLVMVQAEMKLATKYSDRIGLGERVDELEARKKVVQGYLQKARKRLLSLQTRYKELIVGGDNDRRAGGRSAASSGPGDYNSYAKTSSPNAGEANDSKGSTAYGTGSTSSSSRSRTSSNSNSEDAWKDEGFGSFGRGRGSTRRGRTGTHRRSTSASDQASATSPGKETSYGGSSSSSSSPYSTRSSTPPPPPTRSSPERPQPTSYTQVPPHRRTSGSTWSIEDDKRRLREMQVDDDFEKLKKDLGL
jgi:hypothetical protein